jgi:hypothetical protein
MNITKFVICTICLVASGLSLAAQTTNLPSTTTSPPGRLPDQAAAGQKLEQRKALTASASELHPRQDNAPVSARAAARTSKVLSAYDLDKDGVLSPEEKARYMSDMRAARKARMEKYDLNHDGVMDPMEQQRMLQSISTNATSQLAVPDQAKPSTQQKP